MQYLDLVDIDIDVNDVLRSSGTSPERAKKRGGIMIEYAAKALEQAKTLMHPTILYTIIPVEGVSEKGLRVNGGTSFIPRPMTIGGELLVKELPTASLLIVILITLGPELEEKAIEIIQDNTIEGYVLDSVGGAAMRYLSNNVVDHFEKEYEAKGLEVSHPFDPGMEGWPVEVGQPEIFSILDSRMASVELNDYMMMIPKKSQTLVLGVGKGLKHTRRSCDTCPSREKCIYRRLNEYEQNK